MTQCKKTDGYICHSVMILSLLLLYAVLRHRGETGIISHRRNRRYFNLPRSQLASFIAVYLSPDLATQSILYYSLRKSISVA